MTIEEDTPTLYDLLADALVAILRRELDLNFEEAVRMYREVEADFVARAPNDEEFVLETRRRVAEDILSAAYTHDEPFDVCNNAWNELLRLGFTNRFMKDIMTRQYAKCCLFTEHPEEGIAVLEPLIVELEERIAKGNAESAAYHGEDLERTRKLLAELITQRDAPPRPDHPSTVK